MGASCSEDYHVYAGIFSEDVASFSSVRIFRLTGDAGTPIQLYVHSGVYPRIPEDAPMLYASNDTVVQDTRCIEPGLSGHNVVVPERRGGGSR